MHVHHSKLKQAMQIGCYVSMIAEHRVRIFWPQRSVELFGPTVNDVLEEMKAIQDILNTYPDYRIVTNNDNSMVMVINDKGEQMVGTPQLPIDIWATMEANEAEWMKTNGRPEERKEDESHINGISRDGAVAHNEGVPAGDCPFLEGSPEFAKWNDEWDRAAEEEVLLDAKGVGSVVTNRYRATYSESGHPTHCGDELAILLNNICLNKAGINIELFEAICTANGVNLAKYSRTTKGWQGRLRMTGRNLLAKRVRENGGRVMVPEGMTPGFYILSEDWVKQAEVKYKPKAAQQPAPGPAGRNHTP